MALSTVNDELKSNIVKINPAITKDGVLKAINGIIDYLKRYGLLYEGAILKPNEGTTYVDYYIQENNEIIDENYSMADIKEKIDNLNYLLPPLSVKDVREEVNKIIDIFKSDSRVVSADDFNNLIKEIQREITDVEENIDYGVPSSVYTTSQVLDYGTPSTINDEQDL